MTVSAELLIIGREIVSGLRRDTNSSVLAARLTELGFRVDRVTAIPDTTKGILEALAATRADLVIITGGLGSTRDDMTRPALARFAKTRIVEDAAMRERLIEKLARRAARLNPRHKHFYVRPATAVPLRNSVGLAEGLWVEIPKPAGPRTAASRRTSRGGRRVFCALPGVPAEMIAIAGGEGDFCEKIRERFPRLRSIPRRVIGVAGMRESEVEDRLLGRAEFRRGEVCILPSPGIVQLVLPAGPLVNFVRRRLGDAIFTYEGARLEEVVVGALRRRGETVAVAESCTGGELGGAITSVAGSSDVFLGGVIAYHNRVKERALGVRAAALARHGAVSAQVAAAMARGARREMRADWGLAITGIAGAGGGSLEKPVGLVFVALAGRRGVEVKRLQFSGTRAMIRLGALLRLSMFRRVRIRRARP
jgi:nicotinamide-nucleotide amidase